MSAKLPPAVLKRLSLGVGFGGPAQLSPLPSRSIRPAIPSVPMFKSLPAPRPTRFDLVIASSLVSKVGPKTGILTHGAHVHALQLLHATAGGVAETSPEWILVSCGNRKCEAPHTCPKNLSPQGWQRPQM